MKLASMLGRRDQVDNYFPPYAELSAHLVKASSGGSGSPGEPSFLLRHMAAELAASTVFDEDYYLRANPDVAMAIANGKLASAREHFVKWGYFEGRAGSEPAFDQSWYLRQYPDLAQAFKRGEARDLRGHFYEYGFAEGRMGTARQFESWQEWQRLFETPPAPANASNAQHGDGPAGDTVGAPPETGVESS